MAVFLRWCICPVITEWQVPPADWLDGNGDVLPGKPGGWWLRRPKASFITDPGRPANPKFKTNPDTGISEPVLDENGNQVMIPKVVTHSSVISNGPSGVRGLAVEPSLVEADDDKWCLSLCAAVDFSLLKADPDIEDVLDGVYPHAEHPVFLNNTPRMRDWPATRIDKVKRIMRDRGRVPDAQVELLMTEHTPFKDALFEIGRRINPTFDAANTNTLIKE